MPVPTHADLENYDRVYLEKLLLATDILLRLGEDPDMIPNALEIDLWTLRDRIERALLTPRSPAEDQPTPKSP